MARPLRIEFAGALYHVTTRGNARQSIYRDDQDRWRFLKILTRVIQRYHFLCYAYCLMGNHYHLLLETPEPNLSRGLQHLNGVYALRFNQRHHSCGHLFQGRPKAILVEKEAYFLELCRYVVLNPVRANQVEDPAQWPWSSYRATLVLEESPAWLAANGVLRHFDSQKLSAQRRYQDFVRSGIRGPSPWGGLRGQLYLGSEEFARRYNQDGPIPDVPRVQYQPVRPALKEIFHAGADRKKQTNRAFRVYGYRMKEIADYLSVHPATIGRWIHRIESAAASLEKNAV